MAHENWGGSKCWIRNYKKCEWGLQVCNIACKLKLIINEVEKSRNLSATHKKTFIRHQKEIRLLQTLHEY